MPYEDSENLLVALPYNRLDKSVVARKGKSYDTKIRLIKLSTI